MPIDNSANNLNTQKVHFCLFNNVVCWVFCIAAECPARLSFEICDRVGGQRKKMVTKRWVQLDKEKRWRRTIPTGCCLFEHTLVAISGRSIRTCQQSGPSFPPTTKSFFMTTITSGLSPRTDPEPQPCVASHCQLPTPVWRGKQNTSQEKLPTNMRRNITCRSWKTSQYSTRSTVCNGRGADVTMCEASFSTSGRPPESQA